MGWLRLWWRQSDHYDRLSAHLQARGMDTVTRGTISLIAGTLAVVALANAWAPTGPQGGIALTCSLASAAGAFTGAMLWALRWPNRTMAILFALLSNASIALTALAQSDPMVAMMVCTTFATMASYIALFHTAPLMAYNFVVASGIGAFEGVRMAEQSSIVTASAAYALLLLLNLAVPFGIQVVVHVLGADAVHAERDQLTGLLTRSAFHRRAKACLVQGDKQRAFVVDQP